MPVRMTPDQVTALAPDAASLQAARGLATARKWDGVGADDAAMWGLAQGSGKQPYQVQVALPEFEAKCSCPSRKFPCKHALALMLRAANEPDAFAAGMPRPPWVEEWLLGRAERAAKAQAKAKAGAGAGPSPPAGTVDEKARARRQEKRAGRVEDGVRLLGQWLLDRVRQGLADDSLRTPSMWDEIQRRMVDAQAPGLARRIAWVADDARRGDAESAALVDGLGRLHLLLEAHARRDSLPADLQAEIEQAIGATVSQQDLKSQEGIRDQWFVAAQTQVQEERLQVTTTWLRGAGCGRWAELLDFAPAGRAAAGAALAVGAVYELELVFYPGVASLRALTRDASMPRDAAPPSATGSWSQFLAEYAAGLAANPWRSRVPFLLPLIPGTCADFGTGAGTSPATCADSGTGAGTASGRYALVDGEGDALPWQVSPAGRYRLLALSGGAAIPVCGVWDGRVARVLTAGGEGGWVPLEGGAA